MARTRFESGPAAATIASPVRPPSRLSGLTGVGLAQPKPKPPRADDERQRQQDAAERVEVGDRVERQPAEQLGRAVAQPVGRQRVENSWTGNPTSSMIATAMIDGTLIKEAPRLRGPAYRSRRA